MVRCIHSLPLPLIPCRRANRIPLHYYRLLYIILKKKATRKIKIMNFLKNPAGKPAARRTARRRAPSSSGAVKGGKAHPQGARVQGPGALVGQRRAVKPGAHADPPLRQPLRQLLAVLPGKAQRKDPALVPLVRREELIARPDLQPRRMGQQSACSWAGSPPVPPPRTKRIPPAARDPADIVRPGLQPVRQRPPAWSAPGWPTRCRRRAAARRPLRRAAVRCPAAQAAPCARAWR